jgi:uncharacterized protein YukJ
MWSLRYPSGPNDDLLNLQSHKYMDWNSMHNIYLNESNATDKGDGANAYTDDDLIEQFDTQLGKFIGLHR